MRRHEVDGTHYDPALEAKMDANQDSLIDELITPHVRLPERLGARHAIVSRIPAYNPEAQPVQARGRIVWNRAYAFQPHGPSYLDPIPDPGLGGGR